MAKVPEQMTSKLHSVLLIDDDDTSNFITRRLLTRMKMSDNLNIASNGREALEFLQHLHEQDATYPELILLDLNMPLVNGWEFLEAYEGFPQEARDNTKVVILTTSLYDKDQAKAHASPYVKDFLEKPLTDKKIEHIWQKYWSEENA